jgi:hypothetical protein
LTRTVEKPPFSQIYSGGQVLTADISSHNVKKLYIFKLEINIDGIYIQFEPVDLIFRTPHGSPVRPCSFHQFFQKNSNRFEFSPQPHNNFERVEDNAKKEGG